ncbi:MAG: PAS domain S-box protein [Bacteroidota bacterium]
MKTLRDKLLFLIVALVLLSIIFFALASFQLSNKINDTVVSIAHTNEVLYQSQNLLTLSIDNVSLSRGYALTGKDEYLALLKKSEKDLYEALARIQNLTSDNTEQQRNISLLTDAVIQRIAYTKTIINLKNKSSLDAVSQYIGNGKGNALMDNIRQIVQKMQSTENELLIERKAINVLVSDNLKYSLKGITILFVFLLFLLLLTERKQFLVRKKSKEDVLYLAKLINTVNDVIFSTDDKFNIVFWNKAATDMYGYTAAEAIGRRPSQLLHIRLNKDLYEDSVNLLKQQGFYKDEYEAVTKSGNIIFILAHSNAVYDDKGNITGYVSAHRELTERKYLEDSLRKGNEKLIKQVSDKSNELRNMFEKISDAFIEMDSDWSYTYMNLKASEILGCSPNNSIGRTAWNEFSEDQAKPFYDVFLKAKAEQQFTHFEAFYEPKKVWLECYLYPSKNGISVFFRDISQKKASEEILQRSEEKYKSLFYNCPLPMLMYDIESLKIVDVNNAAVRKYGYSQEEFLKLKIQDIRPKEDLQKLLDFISIPKKNFSDSGVWRHVRKDSSVFNAHVYGFESFIGNKPARLVIMIEE